MVFSLLLRLWYCVISSTLQCHKITLYSHLALCLLPTKSNTDCGSIPIRKLNFAMLIISQVKQNQQQRVGKKPPWLRMIQIHTKSASSPFYCAKCMLLRMLTFLPSGILRCVGWRYWHLLPCGQCHYPDKLCCYRENLEMGTSFLIPNSILPSSFLVFFFLPHFFIASRVKKRHRCGFPFI